MIRSSLLLNLSALVVLAASPLRAAGPDPAKTWTDPEAALREDPDFAIQGEYRGDGFGAQVVALGQGAFDATLLGGGLPGEGWEPEKSRIVLKGARQDGRLVLAGEGGKTTATIGNGGLVVTLADGGEKQLSRLDRHSPTLGAKPPAGAVVLFDGSSAAAWQGGQMADGLLLATGCTSTQRFGGYRLHLEFRTPYQPAARGQQRGNSGVYHSGRWETQILDSFGLESRDNHCGGIYSIAKPRLNACLPPLAWQTYDVDFTAATFDAGGHRAAWPRLTVKLNGVVVHENLELPKDFTTAAPITAPLASPTGPVFLQNHGNPVVFRNIWIVPDPDVGGNSAAGIDGMSRP